MRRKISTLVRAVQMTNAMSPITPAIAKTPTTIPAQPTQVGNSCPRTIVSPAPTPKITHPHQQGDTASTRGG